VNDDLYSFDYVDFVEYLIKHDRFFLPFPMLLRLEYKDKGKEGILDTYLKRCERMNWISHLLVGRFMDL
jgi:hypothetical protein